MRFGSVKRTFRWLPMQLTGNNTQIWIIEFSTWFRNLSWIATLVKYRTLYHGVSGVCEMLTQFRQTKCILHDIGTDWTWLPYGYRPFIRLGAQIGQFHGRTLRWRHNEWDGVSNHQPHDCLLNRLSGRRSEKTSKPRASLAFVGEFIGDWLILRTDGQ